MVDTSYVVHYTVLYKQTEKDNIVYHVYDVPIYNGIKKLLHHPPEKGPTIPGTCTMGPISYLPKIKDFIMYINYF
jgi:hypothetical protein